MSRELKDLESSLAHDLNNYLQVAMGNLEILRRRAAFSAEPVDAAINATRTAAQLADRLVAVSRLSHLEPRPLDLNRALSDLQDMVTRTVGDTIRVDLDLADSLPKAIVDPRCLQAALLELVINAADAMPGGGRLKVRTTRAGDRQVKLEVIDTGGGMAPEKITQALAPLAEARDASKPAGFGLRIVRHCVEASGGRVEISARPSQGTTVSLFLPV